MTYSSERQVQVGDLSTDDFSRRDAETQSISSGDFFVFYVSQ